MDYKEQPDVKLMDLIRAHDVDGFDALRLRYTSMISRHLKSIVHDPDAAEDLLQETFLRLWTRAEQWDGSGTVKSWLFRISTNTALNWLRTSKRRKETVLEVTRLEEDDDSIVPGWMIDSASHNPEAAFEHAEKIKALRRLVDGLPEEKRELLRLVYEAEMEVREAAEMLGIPEGTAKSRLHYSARYLARKWRDLENE